ncbi:MAG: VWA domain-containing protein [Candidatus Hydrogenedentota bacterium]
MVSRRVILGFSVVVAAAAYGAFWIFLAPHIVPFKRAAVPEPLLRKYKVALVETPPARVEAARGPVSPLASRSESIRDMLDEFSAADVPSFEPEAPSTGVADLESRLAEETLSRDYAPAAAPERLAQMDMEIVEIGIDAARRDIAAPRRLARPSPVEVFEEGTQPVLRGPAADSDVRLRIEPRPTPFLARGQEPARETGAEESDPASPPPREPDTRPAEQPAPSRDVPELQAEELTRARTRMVEDVRREQEQRYVFMDDLLDIAVATYTPPGKARGYFRLNIRPKPDSGVPPLAKDVTFVVDASSSISSRKLTLTVRGMGEALEQLRPEDYFNLVLFRDHPIHFQNASVPATPENRAAARAFLDGIQSHGETDLYRALMPELTKTPRPGAASVVLVVSDGRSTRGLQDSRMIINALSADNTHHGVYTFGGGRTVNTYLLDLLAYRNKGVSQVAPGIEAVDDMLPAFFGQLAEPMLTRVRAAYGGIDAATVYPKDLPDFFRARGVTVYGRFATAEDKRFVMRLTGRAGSREKEVIFRAGLAKASTGDETIARGWAQAKAYHIIGEMTRVGEQANLHEALRTLRREYGVRTAYDE